MLKVLISTIEGVLKQLRPLLLDPTISIQNSAALALGRVANHSP